MSWYTVILFLHILGICSAIDVLSCVRTSQAAIAWCIILLFFPYVAIPLYWVFGRSRFRGYRELLLEFIEANQKLVRTIELQSTEFAFSPEQVDLPLVSALEKIAGFHFMNSNQLQLLVDGDATFASIFSEIATAEKYVLVQFFIVRDDELGQKLKRCLIERAQNGVQVYFLYDEIGSKDLSEQYIEDLNSSGVKIRAFDTTQGIFNKFQINFRNHRKIMVIDGRVAYVGGLNVGNEYLGLSRSFGHWRDTHVVLHGPVVIHVQATFFADWYWATRTLPELNWTGFPAQGQMNVLTIASGPSTEFDRCLLFFLETIHAARKRLWISTPYFVPDESILSALQLAALRGVDVRIMLPGKPDSLFVSLAGYFYVPQVRKFNIKVYRYRPGFLHQKVLVMDDKFSAIGTANLDNRSLRLNFEITLAILDSGFNAQVSAMLEKDFEECEEEQRIELEEYPIFTRFGAKFARLFAPIL